MARMPGVPFSAPRSFSTGRPGGPPRFIVIHYTAGSEGRTAAEDGIAYDKKRTDGTSAHFYTDRDSIIQCVDTNDRSHTALYHGNLWGIHIEQCGTRQTREQWLDAASLPTIRNTARVCAWAMREHNIPLALLVDRQVRTGRGICGHKDITYGFPEDDGTHEDPGTAYPYDVLIAYIKAELEGDDMPTLDEIAAAVWSYRISSPHLDNGLGHSAHEGVVNAIQANRTTKAVADQQGIDHAALMAEVDTLEESDAQIIALVQAVQAGDPEAIIVALKAAVPQAVLDGLRDRLAS